MGLSIKVRKNCLPAIAAKVLPSAKRWQQDTLTAMQQTAQSRARVDTGRMRGDTQVSGDTLRAGAPYSGFQNYGTRRGIVADYWFSGAVEQFGGNAATTLSGELEGAFKC